MNNLKKMLAALVSVTMVASMAIAPAFAATYSYEKEAKALYDVKLYMGTKPDVFEPDLGTALDRQTGVTMLLRIFGQEEQAKLLSDADVSAKLAKFKDAGTIADWAKKQVAFAVDKGYVKGYAEDSTFRPAAALNGKAYSSLILQQLGYNGEFDYKTAATKLSEIGGLTAAQAAQFNTDTGIIKDALVGISFGALQARYKADGKKLARVLVDNKVITEEAAKAAGIQYADVKSVAAIADVTVDINGTPSLPATVKATYDNGTTADVAVTWPTVNTATAGTQTIEGTIANSTVKATVKVIVAPAELKVEGKTSGNRMELILNFNRPVADEDEAKDEANYKVKKYTVANADLSADKMTVTLLMASPISQQSDVDVTVDKDLGFKEDQDLEIKNVKDTTPPTVSAVEAVGNGLVKVTFSEPVQNAKNLGYYTIDGKSFGATKTELSDSGKVVSFTLKTRLKSEAHKLVVKNKVTDYAGFAVEDNETEFTVVEDTTAPTGVVESATQTKVVIKFSEPIEEPDEDNVETNTSAEIEKLELSDDGMTYTITFNVEDALPTAGGKLKIDNLSDNSGNKVNFEVAVSPEYDVKRPEYVGYTVDDKQKKIIVEFNEDVYLGKGEEFELTDADDDDVSVVWAYDKDDDKNDVKNKVVLTRAGGAAFDSEKHELVISGVKDYNPLKNEIMELTVTIDIADQKAPTVEKVVIDSDKNALYVEFSEDVDEDTATALSSYSYEKDDDDQDNDDNDNVMTDLDKDFVDVELLSDGKTVSIVFDKVSENEDSVDVDDITKLQIDSVTDLAGNEMTTVSRLAGQFDEKDGDLQPVIESAAVTDENTIVVKISEAINDKTLTPDDFIIVTEPDKDGKTYDVTAWDAEYNSDDKEIKLTVNVDLSSDGKYKGLDLLLSLDTGKDAVDTVNAFEEPLAMGDFDEEVTDEYAPVADTSVASAVYNNKGTVVEIEVSEDLNLDEGLVADTSEFRVKADGDTVSAKIYYYDGEASDDKETKDIDESKARFVVEIAKDYVGKKVQVIFLADPTPSIKDAVGANALKDFDLTSERVERD